MPQSLPVYNNHDPLLIDSESLKKADKLLADIEQSINFFRHRLANQPKMTDVHTHMGLFESYLKELSPLVRYDSILQEEFEKRYAEIRAANTEIHRLNKLVGNGISPESISSKLRTYDDAIRLWYGAHGFHYASLKEYTAFGINYEFSGELQYDKDDGCSSRKEWKETFLSKFPLIAEKESEYDIYYDTYHAELLDTDKNKNLIQELFTKNFPESRFFKFSSRPNDFGSLTMRFLIHIPYTDIDKMLKNVIPDYQ